MSSVWAAGVSVRALCASTVNPPNVGRVFLSPIFFLGPHHGSLAQQVRALALQARGRRFESVNSHQHGVVTMSINQLAAFLFRISGTCKVHVTMRRCIHVLRNRPDITSEALILKNLTDLLLELDKTPVYTIDGVQNKQWLSNHVLFKMDDKIGHPYGLIEHTVSRALDFCSFDSVPIAHVHYDACRIGGRTGCVCKSYLRKDEYEQNFWDIVGTESLQTLPEPNLYHDLALLFLCDLLFFNPDRHHGNIIVLRGSSTTRLAPVFDMGNSLLFVDEPDYSSFIPDPYGVQQLKWAVDILGHRPVFRFTEFYNSYEHNVSAYSRRLVDDYLERVLLCSEAEYIKEFWEVL